MRLVVEAKKPSKDPVDNMSVDGGLIIRVNAGEEANLKKLKSGVKFYPFINEFGGISPTGGFLGVEPTGKEITSLSAFKSGANVLYSIVAKNTVFGTKTQQDLHKETLLLSASRIKPPFMEIKKVQTGSYDLGQGESIPYVFITGKISRVRDPRLDFLSRSETTRFGKGRFELDDVKATWHGGFVHTKLTPYAKYIEAVVEEQIEAFEKYAELYSAVDADPDARALWASKYEHTRKLLKPHANEIYKYANGMLYYINTGGNWQIEEASGFRDIDLDDRIRIHSYLQNKHAGKDLRSNRESLTTKALHDRFKLDHIAAALQPEVMANIKEDLDTYDKRKKKFATLRPSDGPLGPDDLPGLKEGISLFPHQSVILAALEDRARLPVDADPGAGKTLIVICDILQQMKAGKVKRPLILVPESLLPQFAQEIKTFSELNPWIISTDSIKRWDKTGEMTNFLEKAKRTPHNTVFLTSYNWISLGYDLIPNGEISENGGKIGYRKSKVFSRSALLLKTLGIDALYQDEVHVLKGASNQAKAAIALTSIPTVRGLTGTLMPGNPYDVTGPLSVIQSSVFGTSDDFKKDFTVSGSINEYKKDAPKDIRKKLQDFGMPSVRKSAWAHLIPKIHREVHYVDFTPDQKKTYQALLTNIFSEIRKDPRLSNLLKKLEAALESGEEISAGPLLARFAPLDIFLNCPAEAKVWTKALMQGHNAISPKSAMINTIIKRHFSDPEAGKVLVFVQFKEAAKNLMAQLDGNLKGEAAYYEGGMNTVLTRFKNPQDPLRILFGVDKTIVAGHNMQAANCLIHADLKWLPGDMDQRNARAARPGQKRDVYIHTVLVRGSAEILKMAKNISAEHIITKANSDFEDEHVLQPIKMSLSSMERFSEGDLKPFIERKAAMDADVMKQSEIARDFYGPTMMKPHGYSSIDTVFKDAKTLVKVPSSKDFIGDLRNPDLLADKDLAELPDEPAHPKLLSLGISQKDTTWFLYSYKTADPNGFLRRLGFSLMRGYYYLEVASKSAVHNVVLKLEKSLEIVNKDEFEYQVREAKPGAPGIKEGLKKAAQKAKRAIAAVDKKKGEVSLEFSLMNGSPIIWVHNVLTSKDPELGILKKAGFSEEPAFWRKEITRTSLRLFFTKINSTYPQIRISEWDDFKNIAHRVFPGLNLDEFDNLAEKKK